MYINIVFTRAQTHTPTAKKAHPLHIFFSLTTSDAVKAFSISCIYPTNLPK